MSAELGAALHLKRTLKFWDLVLYGLAYIAPFAPLSTLGFVWNESNGLIVLAYCWAASACTSRREATPSMTEVLPTAGSVYGFARHSLGTFSGFIAGWMILLDYLLIPAFVYVLMAVALETLMPGVDRGSGSCCRRRRRPASIGSASESPRAPISSRWRCRSSCCSGFVGLGLDRAACGQGRTAD